MGKVRYFWLVVGYKIRHKAGVLKCNPYTYGTHVTLINNHQVIIKAVQQVDV